MKIKLAVRKALLWTMAGAFSTIWGCEQVVEDVAPVTFTNFKLNDDLLYVYNARDSRVWSAKNDTVEIYDKITYSQPVHGELYPNYANDVESIMGYRPKPGYVGLDSATYEVCSGGTCKTAKIKFVVEAPPFSDPYMCQTKLVADTLVVNKNSKGEIRIFLNDVICQYPNAGWASKNWGPYNGTMEYMNYFEGVKNNVLIYHPNRNFVGEDTFTYRVYPRGKDGPGSTDYEETSLTIIVKDK